MHKSLYSQSSGMEMKFYCCVMVDPASTKSSDISLADLRKPLQDLQVAEIWYEYVQIEETYKKLN